MPAFDTYMYAIHWILVALTYTCMALSAWIVIVWFNHLLQMNIITITPLWMTVEWYQPTKTNHTWSLYRRALKRMVIHGRQPSSHNHKPDIIMATSSHRNTSIKDPHRGLHTGLCHPPHPLRNNHTHRQGIVGTEGWTHPRAHTTASLPRRTPSPNFHPLNRRLSREYTEGIYFVVWKSFKIFYQNTCVVELVSLWTLTRSVSSRINLKFVVCRPILVLQSMGMLHGTSTCSHYLKPSISSCVYTFTNH